MLEYKIKNINKEKGEEILLNDFYVSPDLSYISGTTDLYYDLIDGENVLVINNSNQMEAEIPISINKVKRQGWVEYLQKYSLMHKSFIVNYNESEKELYYIMYNGKYYVQDYKYDANNQFIQLPTFTIEGIGTVNFDYKKENVIILTKYYIEDGKINIGNTTYSDSVDFNLNNLINFDTDKNMYYDFINIDNLYYKINYYDFKNY